MNILFDSMGVQVEVQDETKKRLTTWYASLDKAGFKRSFTDYKKPLGPQLAGQDVFIETTRQWADAPNTKPAIPKSVCFSYSSEDLGALQTFVANGGGVLLFTNHSVPLGQGPYWPIFGIQLAAALGISLVFATFNTASATLTPASTCPPEISKGVSKIFALDSGGIVPNLAAGGSKGTVLVGLPNVPDQSGLGYHSSDLAFGVLYTFGKGKVIVLGHSGILGNEGTNYPAPGQIGAGDNETFVNNCVAYLGTK